MKLATRSAGDISNQSTPVVLLHAYPLDSRMWRHQLDYFGSSRQVIAVDLRGYGESSHHDSDPFTVSIYARDVLETLDGLGVSRAIFAGCSMGGYTIFEAWRQAPQHFAGMILCDTRAEADDAAGREKRMQQIEQVQKTGTGFLPDFVEENQLSPATRKANAQLVSEVRDWAAQATAGSVVKTIQMLADRPDSCTDLAGITVPTLILVGADDKITPLPMAKTLATGIPKARLEVIENAGHLSPLENPESVNRVIASWLAENKL